MLRNKSNIDCLAVPDDQSDCSGHGWCAKAYKQLVVVFATGAFALNLPVYCYVSGVFAVRPMFWLAAITLGAFAVAIGDRRMLAVFARPYCVALLVYVALACLSYLRSQQSQPVNEALMDIQTIGVLSMVLLCVYSWGPRYRRTALRVIALCTLVSTAAVIWDLTHPYSFMPIGHPEVVVGRGAAWFINPNEAGEELVLGAVVGCIGMRSSYRPIYLMTVLLGVLATLSRGALLSFVAAVIVMAGAGVVSGRRLLAWCVALAVTVALLFPMLSTWLALQPDFALSFLREAGRLQLDSIGGGGLDYGASVRLEVLAAALNMLGSHPLLGNGLASTVTWQHPVSTHNMYLYFAADYGLIGLLVFPGLVLSACYASGGSGCRIRTAAAAALLCLGLFSHNIATVYPVAMFMALLSTLSPADADAEGKVAPASRSSGKGSTPQGSAVSMQMRELQ